METRKREGKEKEEEFDIVKRNICVHMLPPPRMHAMQRKVSRNKT